MYKSMYLCNFVNKKSKLRECKEHTKQTASLPLKVFIKYCNLVILAIRHFTIVLSSRKISNLAGIVWLKTVKSC